MTGATVTRVMATIMNDTIEERMRMAERYADTSDGISCSVDGGILSLTKTVGIEVTRRINDMLEDAVCAVVRESTARYSVEIEANPRQIVLVLAKHRKRRPAYLGSNAHCPNCMWLLRKGQNYCDTCGQRLDWSEPEKKGDRG